MPDQCTLSIRLMYLNASISVYDVLSSIKIDKSINKVGFEMSATIVFSYAKYFCIFL